MSSYIVQGIRGVDEAAQCCFAVSSAGQRLIAELEKVRPHQSGMDKCLREVIQNPDRANNSRIVAHTNATKVGVNSANTLVAGEDYYLEGDAIVFTARYHLRRGYCCESGCRHCPYGAGGK